MRWLLLDAGNTALKWALTGTDDPAVLASGALELAKLPGGALSSSLRRSLPEPMPEAESRAAFGCSVASAALTQAIEAEVGAVTGGGVHWLSSQARFEWHGVALLNGYRDPAQLGADRWHAMIAARLMFPAEPLVVVCAGTATTVDTVEASGRFVGGVIAPGASLMSDSLARGTARLPRSAGRAVAMPDNTDDAIATGVADALAGLVERRMRAAARAGALPRLVMGGGHARELAGRLSLAGEAGGITIEEHLVLRGLWFRASTAVSPTGAERADPI